MDRPLVGVGIIVRKGELVLLGKRLVPHGYGEWSLPGGHMEGGESFEECCKREMREETGLEITNIRPVDFTNDIFPDKHYVTLFFEANLEDPTKEPENREVTKCEGWEWHDMHQPPKPLFKPLDHLLSKIVKTEQDTYHKKSERQKQILAEKKLKIWNGRGYVSSQREFDQLFVCARSAAEVIRMCVKAGYEDVTQSEINKYWSKGCWGRFMIDVTPEIGVWVSRKEGPIKRLI